MIWEVIITPNDHAIPPLRGKVNDEACSLLRDYHEQFSKINAGPIEETFMYRIGVSVVEKAQELKKGSRRLTSLVGKVRHRECAGCFISELSCRIFQTISFWEQP